MNRKSLGRGLESLIPENKDPVGRQILKLPIEKITPRADQPRKNFDQKAIESLAESIKNYGLLNPIVVQKEGETYKIIAGERRYRAVKFLGREEIEAIVKNLDQESLDLVSLVENIQREDLSPLEEASSYEKILKDYSLTQEELAEKLGKSRSYIANTIRLLKLDEATKNALNEGSISQSQARTLLSIEEGHEREKTLDDFKNKKTNIREVEKRKKKTNEKEPDQEEVLDQILLEDYEERFMEKVGSKVKIDKKNDIFKVTIDCFSIDDVEDLYRRIEDANI